MLKGPLKLAAALAIFHLICTTSTQGEPTLSSPQEMDTGPTEVSIICREKGTGKPLKRVRITTGQSSVFSDAKGVLKLRIDTNTPSTLSLRKSGYKPFELSTQGLKSRDIYLVPDIVPNLVVVRSKKNKSISKSTVSVAEAKAVAPRGDPLQVTTFLPGVKASSFNPRLVVRGSAPEDSKYYIDGIEVPFMYHTIGNISVIPGDLIREVDFYAGGFSSQYGDATGGIVEVATKGTQIERDFTQITVNMPIFSGFYSQGKLAKGETYSISGRRSYLEQVLPKIIEDATVIPSFYDSHFSYNLQRESGESRFLLLSASDALTLKFPGSDFSDASGTTSFNIYTYFGTLGYTHTQNIGGRSTITAVPQVRYTRVRNIFADNYVKIKGYDTKLPLSWTKRIGKDKFTLGVEKMLNTATVNVLAPKSEPDNPFFDFEEAEVEETSVDYTSAGLAGWSEYEWNLQPFRFIPGIRIQQTQDVRDGPSIDPRFLVTYTWNKDTTLKASVGSYSQNPQPQELDDNFGNPKLTHEKYMHYIAAWQQNWGNGWDTDLQVFQKNGEQVIRSNALTNYANSGSARTQGMEILVRKQDQGKWFGWLSYALSTAEDRKSAIDPWFPSQYDQTHNINLVGNYRWSKQWSTGGRINYHTGDRYTPVSDRVYNAGLNKYQPRVRTEDRYQDTLPDFHQLDLFTTYEQLFDFSKLIYQFGIEYIAFNRPAYGVQYNYDYREKNYIQGIPPIPYVQITGEF
ncbi:MAG: TonB-dependent receptor plug domain-containing protein [Zetaproteobacteria bacterium]|nr:TonB-dependent receptor plug domain-containing protein [Zetaproteobacteria bacterium]